MSKPDSLLAAARRLADATGLAWHEVQPFYRTLQEPGGSMNTPWLPKSVGRNIWAAHPNFLARLMFALAGAHSVADAHGAVETAHLMTPGGRQKYLDEKDAADVLSPLEREFYRYLTDYDAAATLEEVEFKLDRGEVVFVGPETKVFSVPVETDEDETKYPRLLYKRGVIRGTVFRRMAHQTKWRLADQAPFETAKPGDDLDD